MHAQTIGWLTDPRLFPAYSKIYGRCGKDNHFKSVSRIVVRQTNPKQGTIDRAVYEIGQITEYHKHKYLVNFKSLNFIALVH